MKYASGLKINLLNFDEKIFDQIKSSIENLLLETNLSIIKIQFIINMHKNNIYNSDALLYSEKFIENQNKSFMHKKNLGHILNFIPLNYSR